MAISRYSTPIQISEPIDSLDTGLAASTIGGLQGKYDEGFLAISNQLDLYKTPGLVAEKDQELMNKKVQALTDQLNGYGNQNLADPKISATLTKQARSLGTDKEVMGMVNSQANYKQYMTRLDKLKSDPKLIQYYHSGNELLDNDVIEAWRTGKEKYLGLNSPTLKFDVDSLSQKAAEQLKASIFSKKDGAYLVNGKVKSADDITTVVLNGIEANPQAAAQLERDARVFWRGQTPESTFRVVTEYSANEIKKAEADIELKTAQMLRPDVTPEQKKDLEQGISDLKLGLAQKQERDAALRTNFASMSPAQIQQIQTEMYKRNYARGVGQRNQIYDFQMTPDAVEMQNARLGNDVEKLKMNYAQQERMEKMQQDFQTKVHNDNMTVELGKLFGANSEVLSLAQRGDIAGAIALGNAGASASGSTNTIPVPVGQVPADPYKTVKSDLVDLTKENAQTAKNITLAILETQNPALAHQLKGVFDSGAVINSAQLAKSYNISPAMLSTLNSYEKLQQAITDPAKLTAELASNPLLAKFGAERNKMSDNVMKMNALNKVIQPDIDSVYKKYLAAGKVANRAEFDNFLNAKDTSAETTYNPQVWGTRDDIPKPALKTSIGNDIKRDVAASLKVNPNYQQFNEFNSMQVVANEDAVWNSPKSTKTAQALGFVREGITTDDGVLKGVNGALNIGGVQRSGAILDNIDESKTKVKGFVDAKNRVYYDLYTKDKDNPNPITGYVQLNEDNYRALRGRSARDVADNSFNANMKMVGIYSDGTGRRAYKDLNGVIPMGGNVRYTFDMFRDNELQLTVQLPTSAGPQDKVVARFNGNDAHRKAEKFLTDQYNDTKNYVSGFLRQTNPNVTSQQIEAETLKQYYKNFEKWTITP